MRCSQVSSAAAPPSMTTSTPPPAPSPPPASLRQARRRSRIPRRGTLAHSTIPAVIGVHARALPSPLCVGQSAGRRAAPRLLRAARGGGRGAARARVCGGALRGRRGGRRSAAVPHNGPTQPNTVCARGRHRSRAGSSPLFSGETLLRSVVLYTPVYVICASESINNCLASRPAAPLHYTL